MDHVLQDHGLVGITLLCSVQVVWDLGDDRIGCGSGNWRAFVLMSLNVYLCSMDPLENYKLISRKLPLG